MRVKIDRDLCIGAGNCAAHSPTVFQLDEENNAVVLDPSSVDVNTLLEAAAGCPMGAVIIEDDEGRQIYP